MKFRETDNVELKRTLNDTFEKAIVAFLNTCDGKIYIGVTDDGKPIGVENLDETLKKIADIVITQILPNPQEFVEIGTKFTEGKQVIEVDVKRGNALYYIKKYGRSASGCYVRMGTSCRSMTEEQIDSTQIRYLQSKRKITDIESDRKTLTFDYLQMLYKGKGLSLNEKTFADNLKLRTPYGKYNLQAELLADENDCSIKVVRFDGTSKASNIVRRNEYGYKCLIVAMKEAYAYCADVINETKTVFSNGVRQDVKLFDNNAFREAWYNACLHNDWIDGTPPSIYLFSDHLEIVSTGGLQQSLTQNDFFGGISRPVNDGLARIFIQLGLIEQTGHGVLLVVDKYGKTVFEFLDNFLRVSIPYAFEAKAENVGNEDENVGNEDENVGNEDENVGNEDKNDGNEDENDGNEDKNDGNEDENDGNEDKNDGNEDENVGNENENDGNELYKTQRKVIGLLRSNSGLSASEIAKELQMSTRAIERSLSALKEKGVLRRSGTKRAGHWEIIEK